MTPICWELIFRRLLIKRDAACTFKFNSRFLEQVDGCIMGGPLSVTFSDIYMVKMENYAVISSKHIFYRRFVDDIYSRRKLGDNVLFDQLDSYHPNIKLTIEVNPSTFLETKLTNLNRTYKFKVYCTNTKLSSSWIFQTPKHYKRNANFDEEIPLRKDKFMKVDYPLRFINSAVN